MDLAPNDYIILIKHKEVELYQKIRIFPENTLASANITLPILCSDSDTCSDTSAEMLVGGIHGVLYDDTEALVRTNVNLEDMDSGDSISSVHTYQDGSYDHIINIESMDSGYNATMKPVNIGYDASFNIDVDNTVYVGINHQFMPPAN